MKGVRFLTMLVVRLFTEINQEFSQRPNTDSLKDIILAKMEALKMEEQELLELGMLSLNLFQY